MVRNLSCEVSRKRTFLEIIINSEFVAQGAFERTIYTVAAFRTKFFGYIIEMGAISSDAAINALHLGPQEVARYTIGT